MNIADFVLVSMMALGAFPPNAGSKNVFDFSPDPNVQLLSDLKFTGAHTVYSSTTPMTESGSLIIKESEVGLSLTLFKLEYLNWNGTKCYLPSINILKDRVTVNTFYVDAQISYHGADNCLLYNSDLLLSKTHKSRLFLLNNGKQLFFSWTVYAENGKIILDETFHTRIKKESSCAFIKERLICK